MTAQQIDPTFKEFLNILHAGGMYSYWWYLGPRGDNGHRAKRSDWWQVGAQHPVCNGTEDAYYGVHPVYQIPPTNRRGETVAPSAVRSQIAYVNAVNCLFAEYDKKDYNNDKQLCRAAAEACEPPPSVIIDSGGGYHCYWLLDETWQLTTPDDREQAKNIQWRWVQYIGGDEEAKDLARVLRVVGTHNLKHADAPLVQFIKADFSLEYSLEYLTSLLPPIVAPRATETLSRATVSQPDEWIARYVKSAYQAEITAIVNAPDGEKHSLLRDAAIKLGTLIAHGLNEESAATSLYNAIAGRAADPHNAMATIRDGLEYGKARPRDLPDRPINMREPLWIDGWACCPAHTSHLIQSRNGNGWRCETNCGFWWQGDGYVEPTALTIREDIDITTGEILIPSNIALPENFQRLWYTENELDQIKPPRFLLDKVLVYQETTVVYGPSDAGKTFIVVDMAMRIAQHHPVMYVAGEDMPGVAIRKVAWQKFYHKPPNHNFHMWRGAFNLFESKSIDQFILYNRLIEPKVIVIDTLSQCSLGADENSNTDMAIVMNNCNRIAHEVGSSVIVIHHTTKTGQDFRGSGAIKGNTYGFLSVERQDEIIRMECVRIKNSKNFADRYYKLVEVVVDSVVDEEGNNATSCVIRPSRQVARSEKLSKIQHKILEHIGIVTKAQGKVSTSEAMSNLELRGNSFYKPLNILLDRGLVEKYSGKAGGYCITEAGRQHLFDMLLLSESTTMADNDGSELFTIKSV